MVDEIIDYGIASADDEDALVKIVKSMIEDGWQPQGSMTAVFKYDVEDRYSYFYYWQTMVKYRRITINLKEDQIVTMETNVIQFRKEGDNGPTKVLNNA